MTTTTSKPITFESLNLGHTSDTWGNLSKVNTTNLDDLYSIDDVAKKAKADFLPTYENKVPDYLSADSPKPLKNTPKKGSSMSWGDVGSLGAIVGTVGNLYFGHKRQQLAEKMHNMEKDRVDRAIERDTKARKAQAKATKAVFGDFKK